MRCDTTLGVSVVSTRLAVCVVCPLPPPLLQARQEGGGGKISEVIDQLLVVRKYTTTKLKKFIFMMHFLYVSVLFIKFLDLLLPLIYLTIRTSVCVVYFGSEWLGKR